MMLAESYFKIRMIIFHICCDSKYIFIFLLWLCATSVFVKVLQILFKLFFSIAINCNNIISSTSMIKWRQCNWKHSIAWLTPVARFKHSWHSVAGKHETVSESNKATTTKTGLGKWKLSHKRMYETLNDRHLKKWKTGKIIA